MFDPSALYSSNVDIAPKRRYPTQQSLKFKRQNRIACSFFFLATRPPCWQSASVVCQLRALPRQSSQQLDSSSFRSLYDRLNVGWTRHWRREGGENHCQWSRAMSSLPPEYVHNEYHSRASGICWMQYMKSLHGTLKLQGSEPCRVAIRYPMLDPKDRSQLPRSSL